MRKKSPQQKKAESYRKDRRNTYGENSRKGVSRKKRRQNRAERRLGREGLRASAPQADLERIDAGEVEALKKHRAAWRLKLRDDPLGDVVQSKIERRLKVGMIDQETARTKLRRLRTTKER